MKVLFIPFHALSHKIPLFVLYKKCFSKRNDVSCAFLLSNSDYRYCDQYQVPMLDFNNIPPYTTIDKSTWRCFFSEKEKIINKFNPDIIVEDFCFHAMSYCKVNNIPRISIQRTGFFRTSNPAMRNPLHAHSGDKVNIDYKRRCIFRYKQYSEGSEVNEKEYYLGEYVLSEDLSTTDVHNPMLKIIPSIPEIERYPNFLNSDSVLYSGPLLPEDFIDSKFHRDIEQFFLENRTRKKVLLTMGLIEHQDTSVFFAILHKMNYAVITTILPSYDVNKNHIFYNPFLPLHYISSKVDLIIHHCGSGMYNFPILYQKPAITLGTQCYDREDVANKLQLLGLSGHVPSHIDDSEYVDKFVYYMDEFEKGSLCNYKMLNLCKEKILNRMYNFEMIDILNYSV